METFKEYIIRCIETDEDIFIKQKHIQSVTFTDICVLIHIIATMDKHVELSRDISKLYTFQASCYHDVYIGITQHTNNEELLLLYFMFRLNKVDDRVEITSAGNKIYHMSPKFIETAKLCGVYDYPMTRNMITLLGIVYEYNTEEAEAYLGHYIGHNQKSARNI